MVYTTFSLARKAGACSKRYKKFARHVGGIRQFGAHTPIPLTDILDVCGLDDTLWVLGNATFETEKIRRLLACDYAEHVLYLFEKQYPDDKRPQQTIDVSRRFANGQATKAELTAAWVAARDAMYAAAEAGAARAARAAGVVGYAAGDAMRGAAGDAAMATATYTAENAAGEEEREWQKNKLREYLERN